MIRTSPHALGESADSRAAHPPPARVWRVVAAADVLFFTSRELYCCSSSAASDVSCLCRCSTAHRARPQFAVLVFCSAQGWEWLADHSTPFLVQKGSHVQFLRRHSCPRSVPCSRCGCRNEDHKFKRKKRCCMKEERAGDVVVARAQTRAASPRQGCLLHLHHSNEAVSGPRATDILRMLQEAKTRHGRIREAATSERVK